VRNKNGVIKKGKVVKPAAGRQGLSTAVSRHEKLHRCKLKGKKERSIKVFIFEASIKLITN
jgi:hypothetical protein